MQYIVFLSARKANLQANDWVANGVGREGEWGVMDEWYFVSEDRKGGEFMVGGKGIGE